MGDEISWYSVHNRQRRTLPHHTLIQNVNVTLTDEDTSILLCSDAEKHWLVERLEVIIIGSFFACASVMPLFFTLS